MPSRSTWGVSSNPAAADRTNPSSSSVSSSRRAVGRASPAAAATSVRDMVRWSASKHARTSSPRASASTKSGPAPRPAMRPLLPAPAGSPAPSRGSPRAVRGTGSFHEWRGAGGPLSPAEDALLAAGPLRLVLEVGVPVRVLQDLLLGVGHLGEHPGLPGLLAELAAQVVDGVLDLAADRGEVDADQLPAVLHDPAVDDHRVHVSPLGLEGDVAERVEQWEGDG